MGLTLALQLWGEGREPAVLVHGFTGAAASFDPLRTLLGTHLRVAAPDLPGHGASPVAPAGANAWDWTVERIAEVIARAHEGPAHLIGYSMGARLALAVALRFPQHVRSLVLESGTAGVRKPDEREARRAQDEALAGQLDQDGLEAFISRWEQLDVLAGLLRLPADARAALRALRLSQRPQGLSWALRALGPGAQPDLWPALAGLRTRTLLLHGARDDKFRAQAEKMALRIPDAALHEVRGAGHTPHLERPHLYAAAVLEFLRPAPAREHAPSGQAEAP
jgi:2-succinyl-6-hydroxy-2,4-cyclohexadiene-1-carboxylate synthase